MMSTASSSSEWLIVEEWDLVDCESISTCSESFSDFSIISWPGDVEPQIAANVTYLDALTRFTEPAVGKASGEASLAESLAELKRFGESLAIKSIKIHRQPSSTSPENEACFSDEKPGSQERDPRRKAGRHDTHGPRHKGSPCARFKRDSGNFGKGKPRLMGRKIASWDRPCTASRFASTGLACMDSQEGSRACKREGAHVYIWDNS